MFCQKCGEPNSEQAKFCRACGSRLHFEVENLSQTPANASQAQAPPPVSSLPQALPSTVGVRPPIPPPPPFPPPRVSAAMKVQLKPQTPPPPPPPVRDMLPAQTVQPGTFRQVPPVPPGVQNMRTMPGTFEYAGFWRRFGAYLIDGILLSIVFSIINSSIGGIFLKNSLSKVMTMSNSKMYGMPAMSSAGTANMIASLLKMSIVLSIISALAGWLYFAFMESSTSQGTLGKMALGIRVTDLNGNRISFGKATGRFFGKILSSMFLCIGYLMVAFTERKQALHDMMAGCLVFRKNEKY